MVKFEYRKTYDMVLEDLNKLGNEGWELVSAVQKENKSIFLYWKRPLPTSDFVMVVDHECT